MKDDTVPGRPSHQDRDAILDRVLTVLAKDGGISGGMQEALDASDVGYEEVSSAFEDVDDVLLALVSRVSKDVCAPLRDPRAGDDVEAKLIEFGSRLHLASKATMAPLFRIFVAESARRRSLAARFHAAGPGAMAAALSDCLARMTGSGVLAVEEPDRAAASLIGLLREPIYRGLAIHAPAMAGAADADGWIRNAVRLFLRGCGADAEEAE